VKFIIDKDKKFNNNCSSEENHSNYSDQESVSPSSYSLEEKISPSSFICHALIGKGSFGEVYLVEKKNTKTFYAMKVLSKDKIMGKKN
jgi:hypothetical protein